MQTFLPYPDFHSSAECLDLRRLGKQRVEAMQILRTLTGLSSGWVHHPAVKMWRGHTQALASYGFTICEEWRNRGNFDTAMHFFNDFLNTCPDWSDDLYPSWFTNPAFHASHRSNLLRKDPIHYGQFGWIETPDLPYIWPSSP